MDRSVVFNKEFSNNSGTTLKTKNASQLSERHFGGA